MWWFLCGLVVLVAPRHHDVHGGGVLASKVNAKRETDYTLDDSFWIDETPAGEVERLLREYTQNQDLVRNIGSHYYQIIYPVQLRQHKKMGISTREIGSSKRGQGEGGFAPGRTRPAKTGKHFHRTSLLIKAFNHKFRLDLELNTQLIAPNIMQKHFLANGAEQVSKQDKVVVVYFFGVSKTRIGESQCANSFYFDFSECANMNVGAYFQIILALLVGEHAIQPSDVYGVIVRNGRFEQHVKFNSENVSLIVNGSDHIIFIVHGWMESRDIAWYKQLTEALLRQNENNVVVQVDWSRGSRMQRDAAVKNNKPTGEIIGAFISNLVEYNKLSHSQIHLIGFSMGGQVTGYAGKTVKALTNQKIGRITALDPSGRSYNGKPPEERLNPEAAEVVAVIHTDPVEIGFNDSCGTVDLFVNGEVHPQPGCPDEIDLIELRYCSHFRAYRYLIEAVNRNRFIGTECESYQEFEGGRCSGNKELDFVGAISPSARGVYYVKTRPKPPFLE